MVKPTIHLNGTGATTLLNDYRNAMDAVQNAIKAIGNIEFHSRDYYVQDGNAWEQARKEHCDRINKLREVQEELFEIALHVHNSV